ncbi:Uncharacterized protein GBIM_10291 [Gryllus bimaculatus]|nr:Uncharacterized protein GBIM_10291 [Gryllus bimaculatus]
MPLRRGWQGGGVAYASGGGDPWKAETACASGGRAAALQSPRLAAAQRRRSRLLPVARDAPRGCLRTEPAPTRPRAPRAPPESEGESVVRRTAVPRPRSGQRLRDKLLEAAAEAAPGPGPSYTWRRYLMLLLFTLTSASNAVQWIQFAIITEPVMRFYGVSADDVNWTSMIYMVTYVPLVFPAAWLLDRMVIHI